MSALRKIANSLDVTVSYLTRDEDDDRPMLTESQKKELMVVIEKAIDSYFAREEEPNFD